ncbi:hypothetical protein V8C42DRAFT_312633 [Trichoderma barbatum]
MDGSKEPSMTLARARPLSHGQTRAGWCFAVAWLTVPSSGTLPDGSRRSSSWSILVGSALYLYSCEYMRTPSCAHLTNGTWGGCRRRARRRCGLASGTARHCSASVTAGCSRQIRRGE